MVMPLPHGRGPQRGRQEHLHAYRGRDQLLPSERALLDLIARLSETRGVCYAGQDYLAGELRVSDRHVRRLINGLHDKGYVAIIGRRGQTNLLKVTRDPDQEAAATQTSSSSATLKISAPEAGANGGQPVESAGVPRTSRS